MRRGEHIRELLARARMSIPELADESGVSRQTVWKLQAGLILYPRALTLQKVAIALGVPMTWLVVGEDEVIR